MLQARATPGLAPQDYVWVDCFFYGFYLRKDQLRLFQLGSFTSEVKPLDMLPRTYKKMKRADTTRQHLDDKVNEYDDDVSIDNILEMIDSEDTETHETQRPENKRRRCDDTQSATIDYPIVDYAISTGVSSVQYVMKTLSGVLK